MHRYIKQNDGCKKLEKEGNRELFNQYRVSVLHNEKHSEDR